MTLWRCTSKLKRISAWVGLLALFSLGVLNFQGTVLCFESDGRVAVESSTNGLCSELQAIQKYQRASTTTKDAFKASHCGHCVDVSLNVVGNTQPEHTFQLSQGEVDASIVAPVLFDSVGYLARATQQQLPQPPPQRPIVHRFLSTVILLI